jgi:hypothetical protein
MAGISNLTNMSLDGKTIEEKVRMLTDAYGRLRKDLEFFLENIDSENITEVTTDLIVKGKALIKAALIENLVVGTNVDQGTAPRVFTSQPVPPYKIGDLWANGSDLKRCITARAEGSYNAADWELATNYTNPQGVTTIVNGTVTTDYVNALGVHAGSVDAENITGNTITGKTVRTAASGARIVLGGNKLEVYNSSGQKDGPAIDSTDGLLWIFKDGVPILTIGDGGTNIVSIQPISNYDLIIYGYAKESWVNSNYASASHTHDDRYYTESEANARFTRPYYSGNYCYLDYGGGNTVTVRNSSGTVVGYLNIT